MPCSNYIPPKIGVTSRDVCLPHLVCHVSARKPLESLILQHQIKESPAQKSIIYKKHPESWVFSLRKNVQKINQTTIKELWISFLIFVFKRWEGGGFSPGGKLFSPQKKTRWNGATAVLCWQVALRSFLDGNFGDEKLGSRKVNG